MVSVVNEGLKVEVEREESDEIIELDLAHDGDLLAEVRRHLDVAGDLFLFERDKDEPLTRPDKGRRHLRLIATSQRAIEVVVQYEHRRIEHRFAPSATVFKVLQWAIGKKGYNLDPQSAAKANLILPGADQPMPRDRTIGSFTKRGTRRLVVDLTLKDFTNG